MAELWKQCGDWLVRLQVLPPNHRICWPDATLQDLAFALRDGVLLCHLVHTIDPSTLEMKLVNQRPALAQFLCLKNIRLFLTSCSKYFDMKETDLFQPSMLYDYSDFAQVLHTLSRLSLTPRSLGKCKPGFPAAALAPSQDEEQIYRTLEDMVTEDQYADFYNTHGLGGAGNYGTQSNHYFNQGEKEEDIYMRIYYETDKKIVFMNIKELGENHAGFYKDILESVTGKS
ncbi:guanine nucleotide exchange factor VAV2, partial [Eurytemora carolleeae]|uniref:guanine nucleotide exchange factor VAV2 n=1 Tax=Eurytemora carolleeae TaxID=1294199 RepID=UPI000C766E47